MMDGQGCNKGGIKCIIPVAAVFATLFLFQWVFHGIYMMPAYQATADNWRPEAEMQQLMWVCLLSKAIMAVAICCLYCWVAKGCSSNGKCTKKGAKFGFKIGLLLGAHDFASYIWLPIPMDMAVKWFVGDVIMGVLIGVVLAYTMRVCKKDGAAA